MSGFGSFMEGLQGGVKSGQEIRRERQLDEVYDSAIRKIKTGEDADNVLRENRNLGKGNDYSTGDPIAQVWWNKLKRAWGGDEAATEAAIPTPPDPGAAALADKTSRVDSLTPQDGVANPQGAGLVPYADGGRATIHEDWATRTDRVSSKGDSLGSRAKDAVKSGAARAKSAIPTQIGIDKLGGVAGKEGVVARTAARAKGVAKGAGVGYLAGQAISGAKNAYGTPTDQMATEMGINYDPPDGLLGAGYDAAIRTGGTARRVGDAILGRDSPTAVAAPAPAAPAPAVPDRGVRPGAPPSAVARTPSAIPTAPGKVGPPKPEAQTGMTPELVKSIPWDKVNPMDLPKFKTQDWVKYREQAVDDMIRRGGTNELDAYAKVDQQVISMQQSGTKALLQEAIMRSQAGDMQGAGNALVQMFQYVPSGTDAVVGEYQGKLVAQFIDEQTGKPVGEPTPVDAQMLGDLWQQYASPAAWAAIAQDRAALADTTKRTGILQGTLDLSKRKHEEVDVPSAQSEADYRAMRGQAEVVDAVGGSAARGLKPSEQLASDEAVRKVIESEILRMDPEDPRAEKLKNPDIQRALLTAIMLKKRQTGQPPEEILTEILAAATE